MEKQKERQITQDMRRSSYFTPSLSRAFHLPRQAKKEKSQGGETDERVEKKKKIHITQDERRPSYFAPFPVLSIFLNKTAEGKEQARGREIRDKRQ